MKALTGNLRRIRAVMLVVTLAILLTLPTEVAAATSGGWSNLGHGATSTAAALNAKVETFFGVGTKLYVGGDFTNAGGLANADHIAVWNGTAWSALGAGLGDAASAVYAITVDPTTGLVFAGGSFVNAGGDMAADEIAVFNGSTWAHLTNVALNGPIFALAIIGRYLYIGGGFSYQALVTPAHAIVRWNIDTHALESITPATDSIGGTPAAIQPDGSGGLYLGGNFIDAAGDTSADFISHWTGGTTWTRLGNTPLNARVRALSMDGGDLYVGGEFTNAGGAAGADKVAKWNGSWSAVGGSSFFGTSAGVVIYGIWAEGGSVVASGYFNNAGGNAKADGIAIFNGSGWTNVGTSSSGTNGPVSLNTPMVCVLVLGSRLYLGGLDSSIADNVLMGYAASYRFRQPDGLIKTGTGSFAGNNVYNANGKKQAKTLTVHRSQSGTFSLQFGNDGLATDTLTLKGAGSGGGFSAKYFAGAVDVTAQVVAGTYAVSNLAVGATRTLTLQVTVGSGVAVGSTRAFLVTATSTGGGAAKDAVKATVKAS